MAKVTLIQQVFRSKKWMELVYPAMVNQTFTDVEIIAQIVEDDGGCEEYIRSNFPHIRILKPGYNIGFSRGHNEIFAECTSEYVQLVNPDLVLEPTYVEEMVRAMDAHTHVGAATGKLLQYIYDTKGKTKIIDTTGIIMSRNGRARDRGQHETDTGQYDSTTEIVGVSGAGPMYRMAALDSIKYQRADGRYEYFDEDFHSYWEDTDLSLHLQNQGWQCMFVPAAVGYHGRTAGSSEKGYKDVNAFVKHHKNFSSWVKQLNYKNHQFVLYKNFPSLSWKFFVREFFMLGYIVVFEISTLKILPTFFKQLPIMFRKRKWITQHRKSTEWTKLLNDKGLLS